VLAKDLLAYAFSSRSVCVFSSLSLLSNFLLFSLLTSSSLLLVLLVLLVLLLLLLLLARIPAPQ